MKKRKREKFQAHGALYLFEQVRVKKWCCKPAKISRAAEAYCALALGWQSGILKQTETAAKAAGERHGYIQDSRYRASYTCAGLHELRQIYRA